MSDGKDKSIGSDQAGRDSNKYHDTSGRHTKKKGLEEGKDNSKDNEEDADEEFQIPGTNNLW